MLYLFFRESSRHKHKCPLREGETGVGKMGVGKTGVGETGVGEMGIPHLHMVL